MARTPRYEDVKPVRELVTLAEMFEAKEFLDTVDQQWGIAVAEMGRAEARLKMAEAAGIMTSNEKNAVRQQADARTSPHYARAVEELYRTQMRCEQLKAKRAAAQLKIEVWRTLRADQRMREIPPDYGR